MGSRRKSATSIGADSTEVLLTLRWLSVILRLNMALLLDCQILRTHVISLWLYNYTHYIQHVQLRIVVYVA